MFLYKMKTYLVTADPTEMASDRPVMTLPRLRLDRSAKDLGMLMLNPQSGALDESPPTSKPVSSLTSASGNGGQEMAVTPPMSTLPTLRHCQPWTLEIFLK